jgi:hypothetical protein
MSVTRYSRAFELATLVFEDERCLVYMDKRDIKWWVKDHTQWRGLPLERQPAPYTPGQVSQITEVRLAIQAAQQVLAMDPDDARRERRAGREKERDRDGPDQSRKDFGFAMRKLEEGKLSKDDITQLIARYRIGHPELERTHHRSEAENWAYAARQVQAAVQRHQGQSRQR